jgi:hypothetical protein
VSETCGFSREPRRLTRVNPQPLHSSAFHATFALNSVQDAAGHMRTITARITALLFYSAPNMLLTVAVASSILLQSSAVAANAGQVPGEVPFVGCPADGMMGPAAAPKAPKHTPTVPAGAVTRLAYYQSPMIGALAPRGWHCIELYGSGGAFLLVTPEPDIATRRFPDGGQITGPAIEVSFTNGDTSGRFEVAKVIARLFPTRYSFVRNVIEEGIEPAKNFQFEPFPGDILRRRSPTEVDFLTPAGKKGMGTASWLVPDSAPISGTARLTPDNSLWMLQVRLPTEFRDLTPVITQVARQNEDE